MSSDMHDLLSRMADELDNYRQLLTDDRREVHALATEARAALAAAPESAVKQSLTTAPPTPPEGEVGEFIAQLKSYAEYGTPIRLIPFVVRRASTLLEQLAAPAPAVVPVAVSKALIKAECALADVAEGERWCDEGDLLQWAERRCAKALANIRPVMKQHQIRTSEWPPLPAPQGGEVMSDGPAVQSREPASVAPEATGQPRPLSPARAILAAFRQHYAETLRPGPFVDRWQAACLAVALEALADQAGSAKHWHVDQLLAIAAELEGCNA